MHSIEQMELTEEIEESGLHLRILENADTICMAWSGESFDVRPTIFLESLLETIAKRVALSKRRLVLDFEKMRYLNSGVIGPVARLLDGARQNGLYITIRYHAETAWQDVSFSAMSVFESDRIRIEPI